jgi:hypothetical protein
MLNKKTLWSNQHWHKYAYDIKNRDGFRCTQCGRGRDKVTLQVHHLHYVDGLLPWQYASTDCVTLCKGCHAREHGVIPPQQGWILVSIDDLGSPTGRCEKTGCNSSIRYEHHCYHPLSGEMVVGSTCIEHLTLEDQYISENVRSIYKSIREMVHKEWLEDKSKSGKPFIYSTYKHHQIRVFGKNGFQLALKEKGRNWYEFKKLIKIRSYYLERAKELACVALKGTISTNIEERERLRILYRQLLTSNNRLL